MEGAARAQAALALLRPLARPDQLAGMARYGINPQRRLGVAIPHLRRIARQLGRDHELALALWDSGIPDARILASLVADPQAMPPAEMERWATGFDSWDVCDQVCQNLFDRSPHAWEQVRAWAGREEEFVRRAAFALVASLAREDRAARDECFLALLPILHEAAADPRNLVGKAVSWALRGIGKRNATLNRAAVELARTLRGSASRHARRIGAEALRELESEAVRARLHRSAAPGQAPREP